MSTASPAPAKRRRLRPAAVTITLGVALFLAGGVGLAPSGRPAPDSAAASGTTEAGRTGLDGHIHALQDRLRTAPGDSAALGALGLAYVQQAKNTGDPTYYPRADAVLAQSLRAEPGDNVPAMAGLAALEAARHHFTSALTWATRAVALSPDNSTLHGILADAYTQLGRYGEAFDAVQRMVDLRPGTPSLARASYTWELRGDIPHATANMQRALDDANTTADRAFTLYHLSQLALDHGDTATALRHAETGLRLAPVSATLLEARAKAGAAAGDTEGALADYRQAVSQLPQPDYLMAYGELLQSLGRTAEAEQQYQVFRAGQKLLADNGVSTDTDAVLFEADHGDPQRAVTIAEQGLAGRPFLDMHDAYAWALHLAGRDTEAAAESEQATALGTRSALFHFHRGMIEKSLGNHERARAELTEALAINPAFHPLHAPTARKALNSLTP
ncbi:tetratricopeptide repeat protein [Kitasatospora sp. NPDC002040]|uniref:tetratricopeptide repeat protein n=1 Tax=Kitasatospora sp. NPDC002040 TaxID=3154661 RepID=UPI003322DA59